MKPRVAFVIQRCTDQASGGAEAHCLVLARHMAKFWRVDILTTTALDYVTWANHYPAGMTQIGDITVRRFATASQRDKRRFDQLSATLHARTTEPTAEDQARWMREQGPCCPGLTAYIEKHQHEYDAFYFFSHLYATTWDNLPVVAHKAILIPLAHDNWVLELPMWEKLFRLPMSHVFNTEEEKALLQSALPNIAIDGPVIGTGICKPRDIDPAAFRRRFGIDDDFMLYLGRIDSSKGCDELFRFFIGRRKNHGHPEKLVLVGDSVMEVPDHPDIVQTGFVSEGLKWGALATCQCLVMPSSQESLSLSVLEAWAVSKPVLVNGECDVLVGQCRRANGGLWYNDSQEFEEVLNRLCHGMYASVLGRQGRRWFEDNYAWDVIEDRFLQAARVWAAK